MAEPTIQLGGGNWAGKSDNLLGYYKEGERFYKQDFTFSRSTTGTYTDKEGYIQEMPYNLLQYSEDFSQWSLNTSGISSIEANYAASPEGLQNAYKVNFIVQSDSDLSLSRIHTITGGSTYVYSIYIKGEGTNIGKDVVIKSKRQGGGDSAGTTTTQTLTNEWKRINFTTTYAANNINGRLLISSNDATSCLIYGAQAEEGTSAKTYFPTTTRLNMPRVSYLNNSNGSLILEPQRTNLITYSSDFTQWGNARTTDTANQITSPDGLNNGTLLQQQSGQTNAGSIYFSVSLSSGTYAQSIFAKKKDKDFIVCYSANAERTYFNLSNGTIGTIASGNTAKIEDYGNGWYRCTITYTITSGGVVAFYLSDSDNSSVVTDSGGVYIYGAQIEAGSYPTTLINTSGSSVTRNADVCNNGGDASRFNDNEGVLFFEGSALSDGTNQRWIAIGSGSNANRVSIHFNATNRISCSVRGSSSAIYDANFNIGSQTNNTKAAIKYKDSDYAFFVNGVKVDSQQSGSLSFNASLSELAFDSADGGSPFYGKTKQIQVYSTALSDTELATLTTL